MQARTLLLGLLVVASFLAVAAVEKAEPSRLIEFGPGQRKWMAQSDVDALVQAGMRKNFIDVTDSPVIVKAAGLTTPIPSGPTHQVINTNPSQQRN